jgi:ADP-heptose:LPS heptosyltransferase
MNKPALSPDIKSVLVYVGGDLIGDALMKLPFVRALRASYPDAHIAWCAGKHKTAFGKELKTLVTGLIDEVIEEAGFDNAKQFLWRRPIDGRHFDLVIDTQRGVAASYFVRRIRHQLFISGSAKFLLSDRKPGADYQRPAAMVQQMMDLLTLSGGEIHTAGAPLSLPAAEVAAAATALPEGPTYIGIAPGAGGRQKCWPLDRFIALAKHQIDAGRIPVFILGPGEAEWTPSLINAVPGALFPTVGKNGRPNPSVSYSIAVGRRLKAGIANDAGVGHILAAADTPLVSLFGPTPAAKFAPAAATLTVIEAQSFGGGEMTVIPIEAVIEALDKLADL